MDDLQQLLSENKWTAFKKTVSESNAVDIAQWLCTLKRESLFMAFRLLPKDVSVDVFTYMDSEHQRLIIEAGSDADAATLINEMYLDDAVDVLEELPANLVKKVLKHTDEATRSRINHFLKYPETSAGSLMTIEFVDIYETLTAGEALAQIKETGVDKETIYTCYVIDRERHLIGTLALRRLIMCDERTPVTDIMERNFKSVSTLDNRENVIEQFSKYDLMAMPVVDSEGRLVGIITVDDVMDVVQQENTEDFEKMAAITPSETPYLKSGVWFLASRRIPWLLLLMVTAALTGSIIKGYQSILEQVVILAVYMPMLMNSGGNAGSQIATLVIRGLALGEVSLRDTLTIAWKELRVSLIIAAAMGITNVVRMLIFDGVDILVTLTVTLSLMATVVLAKLVGTFLPLAAKRLRLDPAIMAGPLITTVVDACALTIYFTLSVALLGVGK